MKILVSQCLLKMKHTRISNCIFSSYSHSYTHYEIAYYELSYKLIFNDDKIQSEVS